ncbi:MAG: STAS domain-containing protein [Anaerolineales bacterium]|nr:STAS domain-containing protein [Anaerolineales bacterium]
MDEFSVKSEGRGEVTVVSVTGRVDSVTAAALDADLGRIAQERKKLVLDLKHVSYLSSAGVRAIVRTMQNAQKAGGGVKLAHIPSHVSEVLQTVGLMEMMEVFPTVDEAAASY